MLQDRVPMAAAIALLLVSNAGAFADTEKHEMTIELEDADGETISLSIAAGFVSELVDDLVGSSLDCEGTTDEDTRAMLEHLSQRGEASKYTLTKSDGEVIRARRKQGQLQLQIEKPDERVTEVSMPWTVAECMLGHDVPVLRGDEKLAFSVEQDGAIRIRIE